MLYILTKKPLIVISLLLIVCNFLSAQISIDINGSQPDESAILDIKSQNKGVLFPRLSTVQMQNLNDPANGLMVFNTTENKLFIYIEAVGFWREIDFGNGLITGSGFSCGDNLEYGGQNYSTLLIGNQCWMSENLNIGTRININVDQTDNQVIEKYCFNDDPSNCTIYGGLYRWEEVMQFNFTSTQGICPQGWHIATDDDFKEMEVLLGMSESDANSAGFGRGTNQGSQLANNSSLWSDGALVNDPGFGNIGFNVLPSGFAEYPSTYDGLSGNGVFWTSSHVNSIPWFRNFDSNSTGIWRDNIYSTSFAVNVRCVKD